ncbi:TetR/AcrR family transcriptional regulator [Gordonia sp. ABSL11-1]|uniref:TetR/AcrR family transcriptional regulator n=1 Tax=Gordonia sp. ABSL11-1 TaxID=3053924 RepID=UPI0025732F33|nr:TetR/AcrR family transcriptional regulator [Gordonia sp. ABSL11-1]MDL9944551.1 TetR/AcrR family transcriptional regulator [Gordonia sp. ABSL11-1]
MLANGDAELLMAGLRIEQVAAAAGVSTQTFHNAYPRGSRAAGGKAQFIDELLHSIVPDSSSPPDAMIADMFERTRVGADGDPRVWIRDLVDQANAYLRQDTSTPLRLRITAYAAPDGPSARAVHDQYKVVTAAVIAAQAAAFTRLGGLSLRQPFSMRTVAVALTALAEGLVLRTQYDPESVPDNLLGDSVVALLSAVIDFDEQHGHIDDAIVPLIDDPSSDLNVDVDAWPDDPEQAVIDAAATEFAQRGYFATRQQHIARRAGVPLLSLRALFPSNVDIVVAALAPTVAVLRRRTENDLRLGRSPRDIISSFPARMAEQIIGHRSFVDAMALVLSLHGAQAQVNATHIREELFFPGTIMGCIAKGQQAGQVMNGLDATDLAVTLTNNIIFRCLSRRQETAAEVGDAINRMFLPVLFAVDEPQSATPDAEDRTA